MRGLGLLVGHLVGDFILQNDYVAKNKAVSSAVCGVHCLLYALAVWAFTFTWLPFWAIAIVAVAHYPVDRWRLARRWMDYSGQAEFATGVFSPWSVVVVDNTFHLIVLFVTGWAVEELETASGFWYWTWLLAGTLLAAGGLVLALRYLRRSPTVAPVPVPAPALPLGERNAE